MKPVIAANDEDRPALAKLCVLGGFLALALVLGGASQDAFVQHLILQATALAILIWRLLGAEPVLPPPVRLPLLGYCVIGLIAGAQAVPLPPEIWSQLPGREGVTAGYALLGIAPPWLPLSLTPGATFETILGLAPPIAALVLAASISWRHNRTALCWIVGGVGVASAVLGAGQVLTGEDSPLYLHAFTNRGLPVGFFANVNHQAVFLLMCAPLLALQAGRLARVHEAASLETGAAALAGMLLAVLAFGVAMAGSMAGWILSAPVLLFCVSAFSKRLPPLFRPIAAVAALAAAIAMGAVVMSSPLLAGKGVGITENSRSGETRLATAKTTLAAIEDTFPAGGGLGSFESVFPNYESGIDLTSTYMNHAHNDYLELALEAGPAGALVALAALVWLAAQIFEVWRRGVADFRLQRAATVSLLVVALHSLVDYPLRAPAIACLVGALVAMAAARDRDLRHASVENLNATAPSRQAEI